MLSYVITQVDLEVQSIVNIIRTRPFTTKSRKVSSFTSCMAAVIAVLLHICLYVCVFGLNDVSTNIMPIKCQVYRLSLVNDKMNDKMNEEQIAMLNKDCDEKRGSS